MLLLFFSSVYVCVGVYASSSGTMKVRMSGCGSICLINGGVSAREFWTATEKNVLPTAPVHR